MKRTGIQFIRESDGKTIHSYGDWGLILTVRPKITAPEAKTLYIDIPGGDGSLDMTEALTGSVAYKEREITCNFVTLREKKYWSNQYSEIQDFLHGQRIKIILDEDRSYYYVGRFKVSDWNSLIRRSEITIGGLIDPYKYECTSSLEDWLWDTFDFETGIIRDYRSLQVDGSLRLIIPGRRKRVVPSFEVQSVDGNGLTVTYEGVDYHLPDGVSRVVNIHTKEGENILTFTGNGTVSVDYRGGRL